MSGEYIIEADQHIKAQPNVTTASKAQKKMPNRVDINKLMSRVRDEEKKQKKENLVFFGVISSVIVATGIIASL